MDDYIKNRIQELRTEHGLLPAKRIAKREAIERCLNSAESSFSNSAKISYILDILRIMNE